MERHYVCEDVKTSRQVLGNRLRCFQKTLQTVKITGEDDPFHGEASKLGKRWDSEPLIQVFSFLMPFGVHE